MKIKDPYRRLFSLWGRVDRQHNEWIESEISGERVLDLGCGYGSLSDLLRTKGYQSTGVDEAPEFIDIGRQIFPQADLRVAQADRLDFKDDFFDSVILKDVMHHLYHENDPLRALAEIRRVLKTSGTLIVFDPNPHWILRTGRKLIRHEDPECTWEQAQELLLRTGFKVSKAKFYESVGIVLSGGYVGWRLCPNIDAFNRLAVVANTRLTSLVNRTGLGRLLLFRYLIKATK